MSLVSFLNFVASIESIELRIQEPSQARFSVLQCCMTTNQAKILHILTGPPGSGKTTYSASPDSGLAELAVYDTDLGNKADWVYSPTSAVLCTSAPASTTKQYWLAQAEHHGFTPILHVMWVDRMTAFQRMEARSGLRKTERNDLNKSVERWYKLYTRHPKEIRHSSANPTTQRTEQDKGDTT